MLLYSENRQNLQSFFIPSSLRDGGGTSSREKICNRCKIILLLLCLEITTLNCWSVFCTSLFIRYGKKVAMTSKIAEGAEGHGEQKGIYVLNLSVVFIRMLQSNGGDFPEAYCYFELKKCLFTHTN